MMLRTLPVILSLTQPIGWVDELRVPNGQQLCCTNNDGRRLDDPEWRVTSTGGYEVLFTEGWIPIPPSATLSPKLNQDGIARVWSVIGNDGRIIICFLPGSLG